MTDTTIHYERELKALDAKTERQVGSLWWRIFNTDVPDWPVEKMKARLRCTLKKSLLYQEKVVLQQQIRDAQNG